jgi:hypothetical protein
MKWELNLNTDWLHPFDAYFSINLLPESSKSICEIGVFKGAYVITVLTNRPDLKATVIDPYRELEFIKKEFIQKVKRLGLDSNIELLDDYNGIQREFDLVHIDGEHTEEAVDKDLKFAKANISSDGLIIVDDIFHTKFIGVLSATFKHIHEGDFVPFLITRQKMYMCREDKHEKFYSRASNLLHEANIPHYSNEKKNIDQGLLADYDGSCLIKGFLALLVLEQPKQIQLSLLGLSSEHSSKIRKITKELLPPIFSKLLRRLLG